MIICKIDSPERIAFRAEILGDFCTAEIADELLFHFAESNGIEYIYMDTLVAIKGKIEAEFARRLIEGDDNI